MATYFDKREQRRKRVPNCAKVGLRWNPMTQRCEQPGLIDRVAMALNSGLGALGQDYSESDYYPPEDGGGWYDENGNWCDAYSCDPGGWSGGGDGSGDGGGYPGYEEDPNDPGTWTLTNPDGSYDYANSDGSRGGCDAAGECYYVGPNGEVEYTGFGANGSPYEYYEDANGNWTSTDPSTGLTCYGDSSGAGYCTDSSGHATSFDSLPPEVQSAKGKAQQKANDAAGRAAGAGSSGGSSGGGGGNKGQQQQGQQQQPPRLPLTPAAPSLTADQYLKKNLGFGVLPLIGIVAGLLILPQLIKKF